MHENDNVLDRGGHGSKITDYGSWTADSGSMNLWNWTKPSWDGLEDGYWTTGSGSSPGLKQFKGRFEKDSLRRFESGLEVV